MSDYIEEISVLIVDDNPQNLQLFGSVLKKNGYKPLLAQNGKSAITFVERNKPDLILLDVMMPGMNGYEVCEHLKSNDSTKHIPIIFITAKTEPEDILAGFQVGGVDYIPKPFNMPELIARVETHVALKKANDTVNKQKEALTRINDSKDRLFSIIGHDLRNPFGGIISFSNLLSEEYDSFSDNEKREMISTISKSAHQGFRLLENLLSWSRSHTGAIDLKRETLDFKNVVLSCIELLQPFASQKNISIILEDCGSFEISADDEMLNTIVRNLISNAIKFSNSNDDIILTLDSVDDGVVFSVKDHGVGIPSNVHHKILDVGEKYSSTGTAKEEGTGLGLMLVQEFVNRHSGRIWFESEEGEGATFNVLLPM